MEGQKLKKWIVSGEKNGEDYERKITETQKNIYGTTKEKGLKDPFSYDKEELDPTYNSQVLESFMEKLKRNNKDPLVLDLGAGKGKASMYMEYGGMKTVKVDISNIGLQGQKNAVQASVWRLPFSNGSFDGIHSKDMLTHIPPLFRNRLFSELNRVIKPGGIILLCSANLGKEEARDKQYPTSKKVFIKLAEENGFTVENTGTWRPPSQSQDWYWNRRQRFVIELKK